MASERQMLANRANAEKSTGPKTRAGKHNSSRNALKHGLTAETIVVGDEDPAKFEELRARLEREFQPETAIECLLVDRLAADAWRLLRIPVFEAAYMEFAYKRVRAQDRRDRMLKSSFGRFADEEDDDESATPTLKKMAAWLSSSEQFHNALARLSRYETMLMNSFNRNLQQLMALAEMHQRQTLPGSNAGEGGPTVLSI
jgi:hypothetical protein